MGTPSKRVKANAKVGRPPAGDDGERVKDYPQVSFRLPKAARDKLLALSQVRKQPQWRLIVELKGQAPNKTVLVKKGHRYIARAR